MNDRVCQAETTLSSSEPVDEPKLADVWDAGARLDLVELLVHMDIFEDLYALWQVFQGVQSHKFQFLRQQPDWRGIDVERLLLRHGVRMWDRDFDRYHLYFRVKKEQERWAEYVMMRAGVPLTGALIDPRHANVTVGSEPSAKGAPLKLRGIDAILDAILDALFD